MKIQFSDFELDEDRLLLSRAGERVPLRPKVFDLLVQLVANRARVVRREELVEHLWNGMSVGSGSLSGLVNELRQALGEEGKGPSSIRTVHARGYQFVASVAEVEGHAAGGSAPVSGAPPIDLRGRVALLVKSVAEHGACGIVIPTDPPLSVADSQEVTGSAREDGLLHHLSEASLAVGFEVQVLRVPNESLASPIWLIRQVIDLLVASRGAERVSQALPLPARAWFQNRVGHRVVGGGGNTTMGPPGGLAAVAALLSTLARRQPLVWVLEGVDRGGPRLVRDLAALLRMLSQDPVLWVATLTAGAESGPVCRRLERDAGFEVWTNSAGTRGNPTETGSPIGNARLPEELRRALLAHVGGEVEAAKAILEWARREGQGNEGMGPLRRGDSRTSAHKVAGIKP